MRQINLFPPIDWACAECGARQLDRRPKAPGPERTGPRRYRLTCGERCAADRRVRLRRLARLRAAYGLQPQLFPGNHCERRFANREAAFALTAYRGSHRTAEAAAVSHGRC